MNFKKTAANIVESVGGVDNINSLTNCATRLRFTFKDETVIDLNNVKKIDGVIDAVKRSGQYQFIIGTDVGSVASEINDLMGNPVDNTPKTTSKESLANRFMSTIAGIFTPIIPALTAAGMLKALLVLLNVMNILKSTTQTAQILSFVADAAFYYLPILVAFSSAKHFKVNGYLAAMIGASLLHPNFLAMVAAGEPITFLGLGVKSISYASSIIPTILAIWLMSYVEPFADRISPKSIKFLSKPLLTILVVAPITFIVLGPIGSYVGGIVAMGANYLNSTVPWLLSTLMGGLFPLLVMTGMHWSFAPIIVQSYADYGYEGVMGPGSFVSNICQGAASLAVGFKTKNKELKQVATSAGITALLGVTEPAMYGVTLKLKKPLYAVMAGGAVGGLYAGLQGVVRYTSGTPGLASFAIFIGENPMNIVHALIAAAIGFIITFALTWVLGFEDAPENNVQTNNSVIEKNEVFAPISGTVVKLEDVNDKTFSEKILGDGYAILPSEGTIVAPFDGVIKMIFTTGHAVGIVNDNGVEILIHVGLDTVKLNGEHFEKCVSEGEHVIKGQPLIRFDRVAIEKLGYDLITPIIVTNNDDHLEVIHSQMSKTRTNDVLFTVI